jgi:hypothetical protein
MLPVASEGSWGFKNTKALYRAAQHSEPAVSGLTITRLAPGEGRVELDWADEEAAARPSPLIYSAEIYKDGAGAEPDTIPLEGTNGTIAAEGLENGADYRIRIAAVDKATGERVAESFERLVRPGHVPGTVINYIHPNDYTYGFSGRSPASPSIVRLPDRTLLASHDVYWGTEGQNLTILFRSRDEGSTWSFVTYLYPCFWGKLFLHNGSLYMLATSTEYGALLIGRSDDGGETWSKPTVLIEGGSREAGGPHKAPMPVTLHNGRLWTAVEYGSWKLGGHAAGVVSAPADADLLDPASWTVAPFLPYDTNWPGTISGGRPSVLEGNMVVTPDGKLVNVLRYNTKGGTPEYGVAIMLNKDADRPEAPLAFGKVIRFEGNNSKFSIYYDPVSGKYWSLVNRVTSPNVSQRNILTLVSSPDLENWKIERDILDYEHNGWPEDNTKVGFQYVDWIFDGDDLLFVSRTAINGAYNYHNANHLTFHRIEQFRG